MNQYKKNIIEAGCDEAGRGCLAGPVFAASVILPAYFYHPLLNDSKQISEKNRYKLREVIEKEALSRAVAFCSEKEIDEMNILRASIIAMHRAISKLEIKPEHLIIDGNRFYPYKGILHKCIIKGDAKFASIAAASVLAKTYRDDFMKDAHKQFPVYGWDKNMGYPTKFHKAAINKNGICRFHRKSFKLFDTQLKIEFG
ncbi:MAG: ribonuclease HII [Bacteroidota bacterium]|nr:ribonuclease HII [Bacteroidota bacterium]